MRKASRSLRIQILIYLFLSAFLSSLLTEAIIIEKSRRSLYKVLDQTAMAYAAGLASVTEIGPKGEIMFELTDEDMSGFSQGDHPAYFLILRTSDGKEVGRSHTMRDVDISLPLPAQQIHRGRPIFWNDEIGRKKIRFVALRELGRLGEEAGPASGKEGPPKATVHENPYRHSAQEFLFVVGLDKRYIGKRLKGTIQATVPALATGLLLMLFFVWLAVTRNLKPLLDLERQVELITPTNISSVTVPNVKEVARVARTLNRMIDDLKNAFDRERRFSANVAHELRTRVTEMRTLAEVVLRDGDRLDMQERMNYEDILSTAKEMEDIVANLLTLARCQSGHLKAQKARVAVEPLIEVIRKEIADEAAARKITLTGEASPDLSIVTDRDFLRLILHNLFSNAVSYAPEGGLVEWKAAKHDSEFTISISNSVQNLSSEDLPRIFEPFWKKDEARPTGDSHAGLGLALVRSLSHILGLSVDARLVSPSLLTVFISGAMDCID